MEEYANLKRGERGAYLSIIAYLGLSTLKLVIAFIAGSEALRADGLNNATDVVASIAVLIGLKISRKPPDQNHHYGHFRAESIASLVAAFIMITVGIEVVLNALHKLIENETETPNMLAGYTAIFSAVIMFGVYRYNLFLAKKIKSSALYAQAQDNLSDTLVSIGAFVGIIGSQLGFTWLDLIAGIAVGLIICKTAYGIFRDATHTLTDGFDSKEIKQIKKGMGKVDGVEEVKDIKARLHGTQILVEATILVDPKLTVEEGHRITDQVEDYLGDTFGISHTHIHIEPYK
ncbi:cation diffusion facilitator family transporter [Salinibacillus xinjiangensis]|uniref:Cation diffusion facilitator family transporter n=1 Tax=Salinibacillus xinjiangensis TaxID=1229268 RepID=A0A6G1X7L3_9BACI|nr:cation diffusion facilitator family transporter [Salinibacillus xinjiangensis]MRG86895.1 cation diffusion facilitator family transporter [Salinibacillus xinjiangensis]